MTDEDNGNQPPEGAPPPPNPSGPLRPSKTPAPTAPEPPPRGTKAMVIVRWLVGSPGTELEFAL